MAPDDRVVDLEPPAVQRLKHFQCVAMNYFRCREGHGGYQFCWCDRRWTPFVAFLPAARDNMAPNTRRVWGWHMAWPYGIAMPAGRPDPFAVAAGTSDTNVASIYDELDRR